MFDIENFLELKGYIDNRQDRRKVKSGQKATVEFFTPYSIVKKMADKISPEDCGDNDSNADDALHQIRLTEHDSKHKFSICLMNPPYSGTNTGDGLYIDFINKALEITNKVCSITPTPAFVEHTSGGFAMKGKISQLRDSMDKYHPTIEYVDKSSFDAGLKTDVCISYFNTNNYPDKIKIIYLDGKEKEYDKQKDINSIDNEYLSNFKSHLFEYIIGKDTKEFINLKRGNIYIGENIYNSVNFAHDILFDHLKCTKLIEAISVYKPIKEESYDKDKLYIFLYKLNASFGEYLYKQTNNNAIKYDSNNKIFHQSCLIYIKLNKDEYEKSKNICSYFKTDFCRLILRLCGKYYHAYLRYHFIPWLDFSKSYTDEELFKMIGMEYNKEEIDKILNK